MGQRSAAVGLFLTMLLAVNAVAGDLTSTYQQIDQYPQQSSLNITMEMRTGATWPTVLYDGSNAAPGDLHNQLVAASLTPVGWARTGLGAIDLGLGTGLRSAVSPDGRIGAVSRFSDNTLRTSQLTGGGWATSLVSLPSTQYYDDPDIAYLPGDRPVIANATNNGELLVSAYDGLTWQTTPVTLTQGQPAQGTALSLDVDSQQRIALAYLDSSGDVAFAHKAPFDSAWTSTTVSTTQYSAPYISLAFGPNDQPGIAILDRNADTVSYASFDLQTGQWVTELVASEVRSNRIELTFNSAGAPAMAFMRDDGEREIIYTINNGAGWTQYALPNDYDPITQLDREPRGETDAALAFDHNDIPLIAYYSGSDGLLLAYDPPLPEPATLLLGALGTLLLRRRSA